MSEKTAMQELKDKLQIVVNDMQGVITATYQHGYRDAMENVIKDIDAQMLQKEKEQIIAAANWDSKSLSENGYPMGESYYTNTFTDNRLKD